MATHHDGLGPDGVAGDGSSTCAGAVPLSGVAGDAPAGASPVPRPQSQLGSAQVEADDSGNEAKISSTIAVCACARAGSISVRFVAA